MVRLKNPYLTNLKTKLENFSNQTDLLAPKNRNENLNSYLIDNIHRINQLENSVDLNNNLLEKSLQGSWDFFKEYKNIPGVYQFTVNSESYVGSTKNLYNRCFVQHKNQAFTNTNKHKLFYTNVVKYGWKNFKFKLLCTLPNHVEVFSEKFPDTVLSEKDILFLEILTTYETT